MKTLLQRTKKKHLREMSPEMIAKLGRIKYINELTIMEYIELRYNFPKLAVKYPMGDFYGFCEKIFGSVYEN